MASLGVRTMHTGRLPGRTLLGIIASNSIESRSAPPIQHRWNSSESENVGGWRRLFPSLFGEEEEAGKPGRVRETSSASNEVKERTKVQSRTSGKNNSRATASSRPSPAAAEKKTVTTPLHQSASQTKSPADELVSPGKAEEADGDARNSAVTVPATKAKTSQEEASETAAGSILGILGRKRRLEKPNRTKQQPLNDVDIKPQLQKPPRTEVKTVEEELETIDHTMMKYRGA